MVSISNPYLLKEMGVRLTLAVNRRRKHPLYCSGSYGRQVTLAQSAGRHFQCYIYYSFSKSYIRENFLIAYSNNKNLIGEFIEESIES
jgi:hypothetical protein